MTMKKIVMMINYVVTLCFVLWQLSIAASYWLVNKSGLPLIFKQDGCQLPAAGQFEEHEIARCVAPLLFCFADKEKYELYVCL